MSPGHQHFRLAAVEDWSSFEAAINRFVTAWREGARPRLEDYLPAGDRLRRTLLIELIHTELELRLKDGEAARVEDYLTRYPELAADRADVLELIVAEY